MKPQTDQEMLAAAQSLCRVNGLFFREKSGKFQVFRKTAPRPTRLGFKKTPAELLHFIERLVRTS